MDSYTQGSYSWIQLFLAYLNLVLGSSPNALNGHPPRLQPFAYANPYGGHLHSFNQINLPGQRQQFTRISFFLFAILEENS
jgi:hypothetical protein